MGFKISWLAVKGRSAKNVLEQLSLQPTGESHRHPYSMFSAGTFGEWYLIHIDRAQHKFIRKAMLTKLSVGCEVTAVSVVDGVNFSSAEYWNKGQRQWLVSHTGDIGPHDKKWLIEIGSFPPAYAEIKAGLILEQEETEDNVDYISEIPIDLADSLIGFRHDRLTEVEFEVLKPLNQKSWIYRLFAGA